MTSSSIKESATTLNSALKTNAILNGIIKLLSLITGLLLMPAYLNYLGSQESTGSWLTILSIISSIFQFNLGIGNGLRNHLTKATTNNDTNLTTQLLSTAYTLSALTSLAICIASITAITVMNKYHTDILLANTHNGASHHNLSIILIVGLAIHSTLSVVSYLYLSLHKSFVPNLITLCSNTAMLAGLIFSTTIPTSNKMDNLGWIYTISIIMPNLLATYFVFSNNFKNNKPSIKFFNSATTKLILKLGIPFLFLQIMGLIIFNTNNYLIAKLIDPKAVVQYQVYFKIFGLISSTFIIGTSTIWSAVTESQTRSNYTWIKLTQKRLLTFFLYAILAEIILIPISSIFVKIWMGPNFELAPPFLVFLIATSDALLILTTINTSIANGLGKLKLQLYLIGLGATFNVPIAVALHKIFPNTESILIANIISLLPYCIAEVLSTRNFLTRQISLQPPD